MSARLTATDRMARLLSVIPWVAARDGATVDEIATRFDYPRAQLLRDLDEVLLFVGVYPFTPDSLIEVDIADEVVRIRYADWFARPLRLSPDEGARLLTAGRTLLSMGPPIEEDGTDPLLRALAKLGMALGGGADRAVEVRLGAASDATLDSLRRALAERCQLEIEYYSYGRDELTRRRVDPARIFSDGGEWYLVGWCHRAAAERVFRVDRMRSATVTDDPVVVELPTTTDSSFSPSGNDPLITLRLAPGARWVSEAYPTERVEQNDDGTVDVTLVVTAVRWLERLLLRLGRDAWIVGADAGIDPDVAARAARRILARYGSGDDPVGAEPA